MIFKHLRVRNLRNIREVELDLETGHTVIRGANASGKTSCRLAMEFALFGSALGHLRENLFRHGTNKMSVELTFVHNGAEYKVTRSLEKKDDDIEAAAQLEHEGGVVRGVTNVTAHIEDVLGIDQRTFNIVNPLQGQISEIVHLTPTERSKVFDAVFGVGRFRDAYDKMRDVLGPVTQERAKTQGTVQALEGWARGIDKDTLKKGAEKARREASATGSQLAGARIALNTAGAELGAAEEGLSQLREARDARDTLAQAKRDVQAAEGRLREERAALTNLEKRGGVRGEEVSRREADAAKLPDVAAIEDETTRKVSELTRAESNIAVAREKASAAAESVRIIEESAVCPTCRQRVTANVRHKCLEVCERDIAAAESDIKRLDGEKAAALKEAEDLRAKARKARDEHSRAREAISALKAELRQLGEEQSSRTATIKRLEADKKAAERAAAETETKLERLKPILGKEGELEARYRGVSAKVTSLTGDCARLEATLAAKEREATDLDGRLAEYNGRARELDGARAGLARLDALRGELELMRAMFRDVAPEVRRHLIITIEDELRHLFDIVSETLRYDSIELMDDYGLMLSRRGEVTLGAECSGAEKLMVSILLRFAMARALAGARFNGGAVEAVVIDEVEEAGVDPENIAAVIRLLEKIRLRQLILTTHAPELQRIGQHAFLFEADPVTGEARVTKLS